MKKRPGQVVLGKGLNVRGWQRRSNCGRGDPGRNPVRAMPTTSLFCVHCPSDVGNWAFLTVEIRDTHHNNGRALRTLRPQVSTKIGGLANSGLPCVRELHMLPRMDDPGTPSPETWEEHISRPITPSFLSRTQGQTCISHRCRHKCGEKVASRANSTASRDEICAEAIHEARGLWACLRLAFAYHAGGRYHP